MNLYLKIKEILSEDRKYRNDDKELIWRIWEDEGTVTNNMLTKSQFISGSCVETIRRTRQKVQENHKELEADVKVQEDRKVIEKTGGNFVFNNTKKTYSKEHIEGVLAVLHKKYENPADRVGEEWEKDKATGIRYRKMLDDLNANDLEDTARKIFETSPLTPQTGGIK